MICKICEQDKVRIRTTRKSGKNRIYLDDVGRQWVGTWCPDCNNEYTRKRQHRLGISKPIDELTDCTIATGRKAENLVAEFFRSLGMVVAQTKSKGPDIMANGLAVEVKSMTRRNDRFYCARVSPRRRYDDLIALVGDGLIVIETMEEHLAACRPGGKRLVLKEFFGL